MKGTHTYVLPIVAVLALCAIVAGVFWAINVGKQVKIYKDDEMIAGENLTAVTSKGRDAAEENMVRVQTFEGAVVALLLCLLVFSLHGHLYMHM